LRNFVVVREVATGLWLFGAGVEFPTIATYEQAPPPGSYFIRTDLMKRYKWDGTSWVDDGATGGPGTLAVQEADGVPAVAGVDTIVFDQGDGFVLTDLGAGDVRVDLDGIPIANVFGLSAALGAKQETSEKGAALGYASLDAGGDVPDAQLPAGIQRTSEKGAIGGYCELDGAALVPDARLSANIARSLRVLELDGAPSVMPVDQIAFDQADGFVLTDLGTGDVRVDLSGVPEANLALSFPTHTAANDPSAGEKAALAGTSGAPGVANKYVTDGDGRNTNARSPTGNLGTTAPLAGGGALSAGLTLTVADFVASGASHARGTVPDPGVTPGTTKFLREDASWQTPAGGSGISAAYAAAKVALRC